MTSIRLRHVAVPVLDKAPVGRLPHVDLGQVESGGSARWSAQENVEREGEGLLLQPGDVAYGRLRPYLQKTFTSTQRLTCSMEFLVLRTKGGTLSAHLAYYVRGRDFGQRVGALIEGAKMPRASWEQIRNLPYPILSETEQQAVVDFLDRECAWIDELREESLRLRNGTVPAVDESTRRLLLNGRWPLAPLKYYAKTGTGHTPSRAHQDYWVSEECVVPWFTLNDVGQIRDGRTWIVCETAEQISRRGIANSSAERHPSGTVLLSRTASVGFSAVMGSDMAVSQDFMTWTCGPELDPFYLLVALRAMQPELRGLMYGSTHKTIYMPDLHALRIPLPSLANQHAIVDEARERLNRAWPLQDELATMAEGLVEYRDALITEAVTGKLDLTKVSEQQLDESAHAAMEGDRPEVLSA